MLTARKEAVLKAIVGHYISTVTPVGSHMIAQKKNLGVSPATIRMEMAGLEEEGYIVRPHTSAGGIPSDKGYRHYVEHLVGRTDLAPGEKELIQRQLDREEIDLEELARTAAVVLPKITGNLAFITIPKATQVRLKRLELIAIQELLIMLILILQETTIIRHLFTLEEAVPQRELTIMSNKLSDTFAGVTSSEIESSDAELTLLEEQFMRLTRDLMRAEDLKSYEEPLFDGLHQLFEQPEFSSAEILRDFMEVLEERGYIRGVVEKIYSGPGVQVAIGEELRDSGMRHFSLVIGEYGIQGHMRGVAGLLGPKRMDYVKNISAVHYLAEVMSQLMEEVYR